MTVTPRARAHIGQTLANLQNTQATLEIYALQSQDGATRAAFNEAAEVTAAMLAEVDEYLKTLEAEEL